MFKMVQKAIRTKIRAYLSGLSVVEVVSIVSLFGVDIVSIVSWRGKKLFSVTVYLLLMPFPVYFATCRSCFVCSFQLQF